jgi:hypothetical protein
MRPTNTEMSPAFSRRGAQWRLHLFGHCAVVVLRRPGSRSIPADDSFFVLWDLALAFCWASRNLHYRPVVREHLEGSQASDAASALARDA